MQHSLHIPWTHASTEDEPIKVSRFHLSVYDLIFLEIIGVLLTFGIIWWVRQGDEYSYDKLAIEASAHSTVSVSSHSSTSYQHGDISES
jgi:hypothetical protein